MPCLIRRDDNTIAYLSKDNEKMLGRTPRPKKSKQEEAPEEELPGLPDFPIIFNMDAPSSKPKEEIRTIGLYGTIKEEVCGRNLRLNYSKGYRFPSIK